MLHRLARLEPSPPRRFVLALALIAAVVGGAAFFVTRPGPEGDPSASALRRAVVQVDGDACQSGISVREIKYIGGPGLPSGMRRAREVVCDATVAAAPKTELGDPRLANHFVFSSHASALAWPRRNGDHLGGHNFGWWLHGDTLIGRSDLPPAEWRQVLALLK
jgi:hypothetical protein